MRLLFLMLLVANLGVAWLAWDNPPVDRSAYAVANLPRVSDLQLWGEGQTVSEAPGLQAAEAVSPSVPPVNEPDTQASRAEPAAAPEGEFRNDRVPLGQPLLSDLFRVPEDGGAPFAVSRLEEAGAESVAQAPPAAPSRQCVVVAGFDNADEAQAWLGNAQREEWLDPAPDTRRVAEAPLHWVLVPPLATRAEAQALLNKLRARGVDSYLITQPPNRNAVSLGLFKSRQAAQAVLRKRQQEGVAATLAEYPREREEHIVVLQTADPDSLLEQLPKKLSANVESDACRVLQ